jgi:hypothetical protein
MKIIDFIILLAFIILIAKQMKLIKTLIVPTRKNYIEISIIIIGISVFISLMYFFAKNPLHYIIGFLGIILIIVMWLKRGINSKGFASMYRYKELIYWDEIDRVVIVFSKELKITLFGDFMEQTFYFDRESYNKVMSIFQENFPKETCIEIDAR